jgi:quinol monooxygenase YgiN
MPKLAIVATIKTVAGKRNEYMASLKAHGERCLAAEPGTLQFDILVPLKSPIRLCCTKCTPAPKLSRRTGMARRCSR